MEDKYQIIYTDQYDIDYDDIADYYIEKFKNIDLINHLNNEVKRREKLLKQFPYSFTKFESSAFLRYEYRTFNVLIIKFFII